ncbi:MAG: chemotaxis protein CheB, partial [Ginsengibacter sp.]
MPEEPHHIIAIGASAGGLEELNLFFDCTPIDSVSYIIVQHLSPDFRSRMVEIIARHSKLEVKEAGNNMPVESNKIYVIPHDKFMTVSGNRFCLTNKDKMKGPHLTINTFFNSMAADYGKKAIGVILSGMGSDGSEGIKTIKNAGGMVIARNPETSEFPSMPSHAIKTGVVDFILDPELMPDAIEDYVKQVAGFATQNEEDKKTFTAITNLIKEQSPLDFSDYKQATILRRIKRRAEYNNCNTLQKYLDCLTTNPEELEMLSKDFLISVTSF